MRKVLGLLLGLFLATSANAQAVLGPQTCPATQYIYSVDASGNVTCENVDFSQLTFSGLLYATNVSNSSATASSGLVQTLALNDITGFKANYTVQARDLNDPQNYFYGIITSIDEGNQTITVATTIGVGEATSSNWSVQVTPAFGFNLSLMLGFSVDSFAIPAVGATVAVTTDAGKYFKPGTHIAFAALSDATQGFVGLSNSYNTATGALSVFVTDVATGATGTFAAWGLNAQDGPAQNTQLIGTSSTSVDLSTVGTAAIPLTTQAGKFFTQGSLLLVYSATDSSNYFFGQAKGYSGTTLDINPFAKSGTATLSSWVIYGLTGPLGSVALGLKDLYVENGGLHITNGADSVYFEITGLGGANRALLIDMQSGGRNLYGSGMSPQLIKSANYTTILSDAGKHIFHPSSDTSARTWTIASNASVAYTIGTTIDFVNQDSAGVITIAIASDTMRLAGAGTTGSRTLAANGVATARKVTATEWIIWGTGLT